MFYLYIKTHNKTGLNYLGKTNREDYHAYPGSGVRWKRHLNKHGYDYSTQILLATEDKDELKNTGIFFSKLFNVVDSKEWANLQEEKGDGISSDFAKEENYRRLEANEHPFCDPLYNQKTNTKRQNTKKKNGTHNFLGGEIQRKLVSNGTHHLLSGEIQKATMKRLVDSGTHHMMQGNVLVVDEGGNKCFIPKHEYTNQTIFVHPNSKEGKLRLGKSLSITDKQRGYFDTKLVCPHCGKQGNVSNMKRWHFEKCKNLLTIS